ncbi:hypothetical protein [Streptomyces sp. JH34]|uniref:hypothetical protein n=1 Tax=Streptomyces sp. JH34 TaxID=2793633 RepID=UPI0023F68824|nr:hypothetical protein [Streptomyces sp. JH34]MDF6021580.1 hypothetical protein [Streptomyces sp. JH34]
MSTERPENDVTGTRRRRSPLVAASVAAAVLLAGGGGAYWASNTSGETTPGLLSDPGAGSPPPLSLDAPADGDPTGPPQGIAPGEPDPHGGGVVYRASGELPDGPGSAAVHRAEGAVTSAEVARLAKALGVRGTPHTDGTAWRVGSDDDGSGPVLKVVKQAPGTWTFARYGSGGPDACDPGPSCAKQDRTPPSGSPVGERAAKAAAVPVLEAVGQDDAALDAGRLMGSVRVVNADPVVGGLPTYGWSTGIQVGAGGEIVGGSGHLKGLSKGDSYPVTGADEALEQLNADSRRVARPDIGGCATPEPLEDGTKTPKADCGSGKGTPPATTVTVDKAAFGLSAQYADGEQILVPSWIFSVEPAGGGPGNTIVQVAVAPDHLARPSTGPSPAPTKDPAAEGAAITSYSADGRTLEVTFWGGVCSTYAARASEDGTSVRVTVTESKPDPGKACIMIAKELTRKVTLDAPLGGRKVVDAASGEAVPRA